MVVVEALYVPKSLKVRKTENGYLVHVQSTSLGSGLFSAIALGVLAVAAFGAIVQMSFNRLFWLALIGSGILLLYKWRNTPIKLASDGVSIGNKLYRIEDVQGFREGTDDNNFGYFLNLGNMEIVGIQYGLYSVRTPYLLSKVECMKVVPYLTSLLNSLDSDLGKDRERKIQQAQVF